MTRVKSGVVDRALSYFRPDLRVEGRCLRTRAARTRIVSNVSTTVGAPEMPFRRAVATGVAGMLILIVIDVIVGSSAFGVVLPALAADIGVAFALVIGIVLPTRSRFAAIFLATGASIAVSRAVDNAGSLGFTPVMGSGAWPGFAELAGLGFLTGWCVRVARRPGVIAALLALGAAFAALVAWRQNGRFPNELTALYAAAWLAVAVAGVYLRLLDRRQEDVAHQVRQEERIAIARELHDMVAHHVTGIVIQAQAARLVAADRPDAAALALERIERAGGEALGAMRLMVGTLRDESAPAELAPSASIDDLRAIGDPPARGEVPVHVVIDSRAETLPGEVVASLHRIAREAVTNARRHANGATSIDVNVVCGNGHVHLLVSNDGTSASWSNGGYGLTGMAERAEALGGQLRAGPRPNGGWRVDAELPMVPT